MLTTFPFSNTKSDRNGWFASILPSSRVKNSEYLQILCREVHTHRPPESA